MSNEIHPATPASNGGYEHQDIGVRGIVYFLIGLAASVVVAYFIVVGLYSFLEKHFESAQTPVSPLVTNAPADTRRMPDNYAEKAFPEPRLENDERGQLNGIRLKEEETLATYDYVDKNAGTIRIPIDRAMDLIAQRGLPVRAESAIHVAAPAQPEKKESKK